MGIVSLGGRGPNSIGRLAAQSRRAACALTALVLLAAPATAMPGDAADDAAEVARLRRELAEKDRVIEQLRAELARRGGAPQESAAPQASPPPAPTPQQGPSAVPDTAVPAAWGLGPPRGAALDRLLGDGAAFGRPAPPALENLSLFLGLDGSKQPQDLGVNALFGGRFAANYGFPLLREVGLGAQLGTSVNFQENAVRVFERLGQSTTRTQNFSTVGVFQRTGFGLNWAFGYDFLVQSYFDHFYLGQYRARIGYEVTPRDEVGTRLMLRDHGDHGDFKSTAITLTPITMGTLFWRHTFPSSASTTVWAGFADGHNQLNIVLGDERRLHQPFVFGAQVDVPLTDQLALFGQANFIRPADTGTVDAFLGFAYTPFFGRPGAKNRRFTPMLPVATNATFAVDAFRTARGR
jgi:hypothetical protein